MCQSYFEELKEWSARKHDLLTRYLDGFVRILGGSAGLVYYVDGFSGPGRYEDDAKGSPLLAAEYAQGLVGKPYKLRCINVESDSDRFANLQINTAAYLAVTRNFEGEFGDHVDKILREIGLRPAIFFLDPFGLKGIEWRHVSKVLRRRRPSELLIRIKPSDLQRLAGFAESASIDAAGKCQLLTNLYGFTDATRWITAWRTDGVQGLVRLYLMRLHDEIEHARGTAFAHYYPIRSLEGELKYYLVFVTGHPKGAVLMNDIVYNVEAQYKHDVKELKKRSPRQLSLFGTIEPTEEEVVQAVVDQLIPDIMVRFNGQESTRLEIRAALLEEWFGRSKGTHFTRAFKQMEESGKILGRSGPYSDDDTEFKFEWETIV